MQAYELRSLTSAEIGQKLDETYEELFNLRFQRATGQLKNTARKGELRREVARLKTVLRERELAAWMAAQEEK
ncbi:MAG: 50S ribosomal protein L29 [Caldilineales bacterium]